MGMITLSPRYISAPEVSLIMRLEVLLAPFWVWLVLGEVPSIQTLIWGGDHPCKPDAALYPLNALSLTTLK